MAFPKKKRRKIIVNGTEFHYRSQGHTITTILNTKTNELLKFHADPPISEESSTMTPKDVERAIKNHYGWT